MWVNFRPPPSHVVAVKMLPYLEAEAKERQTRKSVPERIPEQDKGDARDKAAAAVGVNPRYVSDAKAIKEESPEVFENIIRDKGDALPAGGVVVRNAKV